MGLVDILQTGRSGLKAAQVGIQTVGQNVTNASTVGYSRRSVVLAPGVPAPFGGRGVEVVALKRADDPLLRRTLLGARGEAGSAEARSSSAGAVATAFDELDIGGPGAAMDDLFASFRLLEARPDDMGVREDVLSRAEAMAVAFSRQAETIHREQVDADTRIRTAVERIDELAGRIAELNAEIGAAEGRGGSHELRDRRDQLVGEVSKLIDVSSIDNADGTITLVVCGGIPIVDGREARNLRIDPASAPGAARVQYGEDGGPWIDITDRIRSGEIAGYLTARDVDLQGLADRLDQLAFDVASAIDAVHQTGFGLDGLDGRRLFAALGGPAGAAAALSVDVAVAGNPSAVAAAQEAGLPGDNRNALAIAALSDANVAGGGTETAAEEYAALVGQAASNARQAEEQVETRQAAESQSESLLAEQVGVSIDEEMVDMIAFERAYQAASKLISMADEMYQTLLSMK